MNQLKRIRKEYETYMNWLSKKPGNEALIYSYQTTKYQEFMAVIENMDPKELDPLKNTKDPLHEFYMFISGFTDDHVNRDIVGIFIEEERSAAEDRSNT